ncbi:MAG: IS256 family transposase [Bacteroidales bacterium]
MEDDVPFEIPEEQLKKMKTQEELEAYISKLYKHAVQTMLKAEMDEHLGYKKHDPEGKNTGNSRNGSSGKTLKTDIGDIPLDVPRDRNSSFDPVLVPKHQRMSAKIEQAIITMYSKGMSTRDIEDTINDIYGVKISESSISNITSVVLEDIKQWQQKPLEPVYYIIWMDGIVMKVRQNGKVINKTIYLIIGVNRDGYKEVLGMWINETESASFWLSALNDLKARGVEDVLIACTDNLAGIKQAIKAIFPATITQLCIVHQIRNSCKYVGWKERKAFVADLRLIYGAPNKQMAEDALKDFAAKWGDKYGYAVKSWKDNWDHLTAFFDYPQEIRSLIYTTNPVESLNSTIRKYTRSKTVFPDDQAALKAVFLAISNVQRKWTMQIRNWGQIVNQFVINFEDRCRI